MSSVSNSTGLAWIALLFATAAAAVDETPEQIAASAGCATVESCLAVATTRHVHAERRYWAMRFLQAHDAPEAAAAFADLADADLWKLRDVAWWYFATHPDAAKPHLARLVQALRRYPNEVYRLPDVGGADWEPLRSLALRLDAPGLGERGVIDLPSHLVSLDPGGALELGFDVIRGDIEDVRAPDALIAGLFERSYESRRWPETRAHLEAIISGEGSTESRRRAVVALAAGIDFESNVSHAVRKAYETAPEPVQRQLRLGFHRWIGTADEHATDLRGKLRDDPRDALLWAELAGPAGAAVAPEVAAFLTHPDSDLRMFAQTALFTIDREAWRRELPRLAVSPDIETVLQARALADEDGPESYAAALEAGSGHWYPRLEQAWNSRRSALALGKAEYEAREAARAAEEAAAARGDITDAASEEAEVDVVELESIAPQWFVTYAEACPAEDDAGGRDGERREPDTLFSSPATLAAAATYADVDAWGFDAALRFAHGWLSGGSRRQHEGALMFTPDNAPGYQLDVSIGSEPLLMFEHGGAAFAVIGGTWVSGGFSAELVKIESRDGKIVATSLLQLPAPPVDGVVRDDRVLVKLDRNGWVDLTVPQAPRWLGCSAEPPANRR